MAADRHTNHTSSMCPLGVLEYSSSEGYLQRQQPMQRTGRLQRC